MINIEIRQNGVYDLGYPYNTSVDSYFQSLTSDFISNYGLDTTTVNAINDHKNATLEFDRDLHTFLESLSAFIVGFEQTGQVIIDEFEALLVVKAELEARQYELETNKDASVTEYEFIASNIAQIEADLVKINDLILYYQSQITDATYVYNSSFITDTEARLTLLPDILAQNESDADFYKNSLYTETANLSTIKTKVAEYSFKETSLRALYEAWIKRPEEYYQTLAAYYKDEYDAVWTYGSSLMYGETLEAEIAEFNIYKTISGKWQETLFKRYNFTIETELKEYALAWLNTKPTFEEFEFILAVETRRKEILLREIASVEQIIIGKVQAVRSVITLTQENNYNKYKELIQEKRKYIYMNIVGNTISQDMLDNYDKQILLIEKDYLTVESKLAQKTYWDYYADLERHQELLIDLNRQLDVTDMAISRDFQQDLSSNAEFLAKIEFYTSEKASMEDKIAGLVAMKDKLELDNNVYNDELTLINSKLYENSTLLVGKRAEYQVYFDERLPFFTQDVAVSENEGILGLLNGGFQRGYDVRYDTFVNYSSNIQWYNIEDREKLKSLYSKLLNILEVNLKSQWEREFGHNILDGKKLSIYEYYFDTSIIQLFAIINKHLLDESYSTEFISDIQFRADSIKTIFEKYVEIAFGIKESITVKMNAFDYNDVFTFNIAAGEETKESVLLTFFNVLDDITSFAYNKNIEYKIIEDSMDSKDKIDQIWLDMEKIYV